MRDPRPRRTTMRDVAAAAGVSVSTVSYVLNGRTDQRIPDATAARVRVAAAALEYQANSLAKAVRTGRSDVVLLSLEMLDDPWSLGLIEAVRARVANAGMMTLVTPDDWYSTTRAISPAVTFIDNPHRSRRSQLRELAEQGRRLVVMTSDEEVQPDGFDVVRSPAPPAATLMLEHLLERTDDIVCLSGERHAELAAAAEPNRIDPYREIADAGRLRDPEIVFYAETAADAYVAVDALLHRRVPRAIYCTTDFAGVMAIGAVHAHGLRVPEDVMVTGLGNAPAAAAADPPLTTAGPSDAYGVFVDRIGEALTTPPLTAPVTVAWSLIERRSTQKGTEA